MLQAKKGGSLAPPRKPLGDKAVNEISPQKTAENLQKGKKLSLKVATPKFKVSPKLDDSDLWADVCSYKDVEGKHMCKIATAFFISFFVFLFVDNMEDILPQSEALGVEGIVNILNIYANRCSTPTPDISSPEKPETCFDMFELHCGNVTDLCEESVGDVSLPSLDFDDCSF